MEYLLLIVLNIFLFYKTTNNMIILDDIPWFSYIKNRKFKDYGIKNIHVYISHKLYGIGTLSVNHKHSLVIDHWFRILLNTSISVLIYVCLGKNNISFWASILYICNPVNNQITLWANGRRYAINVILVLLMVSIGSMGAILYPLTYFFHMTAFFSPILLAYNNPLFILLIPVTIAIAYKSIINKINQRKKTMKDEDRLVFKPNRLIIIVKNFGHYIFNMLAPNIVSYIYPTLHTWGVTKYGNKDAYSINKDFYKGILAIILSIVSIVLFTGQNKYFAIFAILSTLQWCSIIPVIQDLADRYISVANVFVMFLLSYSVINLFPESYTIILVALSIYYSSKLFIAQRMYKNMFSFWDYHLYFFPECNSPRKYAINHYLHADNKGIPKDIIKAWYLCKEGLKHNPNDFIFLHQSAICHAAIGEYELARKFANKAKENYYIGTKDFYEPQINSFLSRLPKSKSNR